MPLYSGHYKEPVLIYTCPSSRVLRAFISKGRVLFIRGVRNLENRHFRGDSHLTYCRKCVALRFGVNLALIEGIEHLVCLLNSSSNHEKNREQPVIREEQELDYNKQTQRWLS